MKTFFAALHPLGRTGRRAYAQWGFGLMACKFALDRVLALSLGASYWGWLSYWHPAGNLGRQGGTDPVLLAVLLLTASVPFVAVGVLLTLRRLRDLGASPWLVLLFFLPGVNLALFVLLCLLPARESVAPPPPEKRGWLGWLARVLALRSRALSAVVAMVATAVLVLPMTALATVFFREYGWGVFVAMPFLLGLVAAVVHSAPAPRGFGEVVAVALLALVFSAMLVLAAALEGAICLLMLAPLAVPFVLLGAAVGHALQKGRWDRAGRATSTYRAAWLALPVAFFSEDRLALTPTPVSATSSVEIAACPAEVWKQVVSFSELPAPGEWVFRSGIAYPVRATISGTGVGAVRRCEFSTGPFVEPITVWDEPRRLGFAVAAQPHPMHELSPYRAIHPPHLDGFFRSQRGEFRLVALDGNRTRLEGTTWYTQQLWPAGYWQLWSDYLLHRIHGRVLAHIRDEAEKAADHRPPSGS